MTQEQKFESIKLAYVNNKVDDSREVIKVLDGNLPKEVEDKLREMTYELDDEAGSFDLSYSIMSDACDLVTNVELEELDEVDFNACESASVYTFTQLSYLNVNNQSDISSLMKEYDTDIATACAIWYDERVNYIAQKLRDWINELELSEVQKKALETGCPKCGGSMHEIPNPEDTELYLFCNACNVSMDSSGGYTE